MSRYAWIFQFSLMRFRRDTFAEPDKDNELSILFNEIPGLIKRERMFYKNLSILFNEIR